MKTKQEFLSSIRNINRYSLLARFKMDCDYWLGNGNKCNKYLWGLEPSAHVAYMGYLWDSFPDDEKPEWITREEIDRYGELMRIDAD